LRALELASIILAQLGYAVQSPNDKAFSAENYVSWSKATSKQNRLNQSGKITATDLYVQLENFCAAEVCETGR
jgi:hypothetical protein